MVQLLGGLSVTIGTRRLTHFRTHKTAALLAYIAFHLPEAVPRELLTELLWPGVPARAGRQSLSMALSSLRDQLRSSSDAAAASAAAAADVVVVADRFTVGLNPAYVTTDVARFESALLRADADTDEGERVSSLKDAVSIYRGELLPGFYESWIPSESVRLADVCILALCRLAEKLAGLGHAASAIACARRAIGIDPMREEPYRDLMRIYAAAGEPAIALQLCGQLERLLRRELGQEPSVATLHLAAAIRREVGREAPPARNRLGRPMFADSPAR